MLPVAEGGMYRIHSNKMAGILGNLSPVNQFG